MYTWNYMYTCIYGIQCLQISEVCVLSWVTNYFWLLDLYINGYFPMQTTQPFCNRVMHKVKGACRSLYIVLYFII